MEKDKLEERAWIKYCTQYNFSKDETLNKKLRKELMKGLGFNLCYLNTALHAFISSVLLSLGFKTQTKENNNE